MKRDQTPDMFGKVTRILLFVLSLIIVALGQVYIFYKNLPGGIVNFTLAILLLVFVFLPEFKYFKGLGMEAQLREKFDEADRIIARLKNLFGLNAKMLLSISARMGRLDAGFSREERFSLLNDLDAELSDLGFSVNEKKEISLDFHRYALVDLSYPLFKKLRSSISSNEQKIPQNLVDLELETLSGLIFEQDWQAISEKYVALIRNSKSMSSDTKSKILELYKDTLEDMKFYCSYAKFRQAETWLNGKIE